MKTLLVWFVYCMFFFIFDLNILQYIIPTLVIELVWIMVFAVIIAQGCFQKESPIYKHFNSMPL